MDRFIESCNLHCFLFLNSLKSNMDRFIGEFPVGLLLATARLKSNMDRFIGNLLSVRLSYHK